MYSKSEQAEQEEGQTVPDEQNKDAASQEPTVAALQAQLAAEKTQRDADRRALVALQAERRQEKANAFVDALITENNEKLLAMTPLGRQALERKRRAAAGH
jgi:hypothetical protein